MEGRSGRAGSLEVCVIVSFDEKCSSCSSSLTSPRVLWRSGKLGNVESEEARVVFAMVCWIEALLASGVGVSQTQRVIWESLETRSASSAGVSSMMDVNAHVT